MRMLFSHFTGEHLKFLGQANTVKPEYGKSGFSSLQFDVMVYANHHLKIRQVSSEGNCFTLLVASCFVTLEEKAGEKHQVFVLGHVQFEAPVMYSQG